MKVAILCGGRGTRIREVSDLIPKPMIPVGNRPILWHIMKIFSAQGFNEFVLLLGYKGQVIREFFLNFAAHTADMTIDMNVRGSGRVCFHSETQEPWKITLVDTGEQAMTGARLWRARKFLADADGFMATYGDGIGNVDLGRLLKFHQAHGKTGTLTGVRPPGRFGEMEVQQSRVCKFNEKPQVSEGYINGGFFVFDPSIFDRFLNDREDLVLEKEPLERMASSGELMMCPHDGFWQPMDTPREYQLINELWAGPNPPWKIW
ncbi:MAG: glucose-1-phosphate cytidylyltransferase [Verrucomicrobiota bacterium]